MRVVWNDGQDFIINLFCSFNILSDIFFENSIIYPQVDISLPVNLFLYQWLIGDGSFVDVPDPLNADFVCLFFKSGVVEPEVVLVLVGQELCF